MVVDEKGDVIQASVNEEESIPILNTAALEAAKNCKCRPRLEDGVPVKFKSKIGFTFDLDFADPQAAKANNLYRFTDVSVYPLITYKEPPNPKYLSLKPLQDIQVVLYRLLMDIRRHQKSGKSYQFPAQG